MLILLTALVLWGFWRLRQQEEWARVCAARLCRQQQVQLLEVALQTRRLTRQGLLHVYVMDFSLAPQDRYQAQFVMRGRQLLNVTWPVMREQAP